MFIELAISFVMVGAILFIVSMLPNHSSFVLLSVIFMVAAFVFMVLSFTSFAHETKTIIVSDKLNNNIVVAHGSSENCNNDVSYLVIKDVDYSHLKINGTYSVETEINGDSKIFGEGAIKNYIRSINTNCEDKQACVV